MALPLLSYTASTQNSRINGYEIPGDDQAVIFSTQNILSIGDLDTLIGAAYRQIFFHAFKSDREAFLESQLRSGQITVKEFIRGLLLSDTYRRAFYGMNSNYKCVEQTVQRVLGRDPYSNGEKLAWSIVIASKGFEAFVDEVLNSDEYLDNFGDDIVPYQRRRVLPGRDTGELPFNIKSPRYDEYYRSVLGFPQIVWQAKPRSSKPQVRKEPEGVAGSPSDFMAMARSYSNLGNISTRVSTSNLDIDSDVPYRKVNYEIAGPAVTSANS